MCENKILLIYFKMPIIFLIILLTKGSNCNWASEWLAPLEYKYKDIRSQNIKNQTLKFTPAHDASQLNTLNRYHQLRDREAKNIISNSPNEDVPSNNLKTKLEETLKIAEALTKTLELQIKAIENQEILFKEAIANGRSGITTLTVSALGQTTRTYIIRDGFWTLCSGMVQYPRGHDSYDIFTELYSAPRCIGQEVSTKRDPCVFNSIIKYETIPVIRRSTYYEDDYLCLKATFNSTIENYMSVSKKVVDDTCTNGIVRSVADNVMDCGIRILSEYKYFPQRVDTTSTIPLEYCTENDGSCKLTVAWHLSNKTIENFEFLENDQNFKKLFIGTDSYVETFI